MVISYGSSIAFVIHSVEGSTIKIFYGISIGIGYRPGFAIVLTIRSLDSVQSVDPSLSTQLRDLSIAFAIHSVDPHKSHA